MKANGSALLSKESKEQHENNIITNKYQEVGRRDV